MVLTDVTDDCVKNAADRLKCKSNSSKKRFIYQTVFAQRALRSLPKFATYALTAIRMKKAKPNINTLIPIKNIQAPIGY